MCLPTSHTLTLSLPPSTVLYGQAPHLPTSHTRHPLLLPLQPPVGAGLVPAHLPYTPPSPSPPQPSSTATPRTCPPPIHVTLPITPSTVLYGHASHLPTTLTRHPLPPPLNPPARARFPPAPSRPQILECTMTRPAQLTDKGDFCMFNRQSESQRSLFDDVRHRLGTSPEQLSRRDPILSSRVDLAAPGRIQGRSPCPVPALLQFR